MKNQNKLWIMEHDALGLSGYTNKMVCLKGKKLEAYYEEKLDEMRSICKIITKNK